MNYQLSRRSFIRLSTAITLAQLLSGCDRSQKILEILFLVNSIPIQLIGDFRKTISVEGKADFIPQNQLEEAFASLSKLSKVEESNFQSKNLFSKIFDKSKKYPDLASLGDYWLSPAIKQNLLEPLDTSSLTNWEKLPLPWQKLVRRNNEGNITSEGKIWGAPYRWGSVVIAYKSDKLDELGLTINDWQDLWNPKLCDRISLLDSPRETIGLTLKKLGYSYNTENISSISQLKPQLQALDKQVKAYSSDRYLESLILGDTWVAVGWSTDILPVIKRYPEIKFTIPQSGTSLWADLWVKPRLNPAVADENNNNPDVTEKWIDFCWESKAAKQISLFTDGFSPVLLSMKPEELPKDLQGNDFLNSDVIKSEKSEFLLPQTPKTKKQYRDLWLEIRQSKGN